MDLLYQRYSNPLDLIKMYVNRGRFGEFVESVIDAENERLKEEAEKDDNWKLWTMYVNLLANGLAEGSFQQWKDKVIKNTNATISKSRDEDLTEDGMKSIMDRLFST